MNKRFVMLAVLTVVLGLFASAAALGQSGRNTGTFPLGVEEYQVLLVFFDRDVAVKSVDAIAELEDDEDKRKIDHVFNRLFKERKCTILKARITFHSLIHEVEDRNGEMLRVYRASTRTGDIFVLMKGLVGETPGSI